MKKETKIGLGAGSGIVILLLIVIFLSGCATSHIEGRTLEGALIGGGAGYLLCGPKCAYAGAALLGGAGHVVGTQEEMAGKTLRPVKKVVVKKRKTTGVDNADSKSYSSESCYAFETIEAQAECFREKTRALKKLSLEERRYAREKARRGY